jgi:uncharacterized membrane protein
MNEYLNALSTALERLDISEREDILSDYREHFEIGLSQGKTEAQIAKELGEPSSIAKMFTALNATNRAEQTKRPQDAFRMVGAAFAYQIGRGAAIGTLYMAFILCIIPFFVLGPALWLSAGCAFLLTALEFIKGYIAYGILAIFTGAMLLALGTICLMGTRFLWSITIGALSSMNRRMMHDGIDKEKQS